MIVFTTKTGAVYEVSPDIRLVKRTFGQAVDVWTYETISQIFEGQHVTITSPGINSNVCVTAIVTSVRE